MTSDDELLKLETAAIQSIDGELRGPALKAAARIRELLAQLPGGMEHCTIEFKECEHGHGRLVATNWVDHGCHVCRIRELEAELDALKSDLSGYMSAANTYVNELHGVHAGTHTIVPVEPTPEMIGVGKSAFDLDLNAHNLVTVLYRAMIRAAQPDAKHKQGE